MAALIDPATGSWDEEIIRGLFWDMDIDQILRIPLPRINGTDIRAWHFTQHGHYSVRSAYFLARDLKKAARMCAIGGPSTQPTTNWNWVWQITIPYKIKVFLWRALRDSLPTRVALSRRGIMCDTSYLWLL